MYNYKLAALFLLCCFLLVDVIGGCPCRHRKRHRKCGSGSSDTHSSESSSESSEHHKKHHSTAAPTNGSTAAPPTGSTAAPATGSTAAPATAATAAPPTAATAAPPTAATAAPPTRSTAAPATAATAAPPTAATAAPPTASTAAQPTRSTAAPPTAATAAPPTASTAAPPSTGPTITTTTKVSSSTTTSQTTTTTQKATTTTSLPGGPTTSRPTCCPSGWIRFNKTNSCYLVQNNANWTDAEQICVSKNAHLVSIHSDDEENFVLNLTRTGQSTSDVNSGVWIGLKAVVTGKSFEWTDGSPVDYTKWAVSSKGNEPDGAGQFGPPANCVDVHPDTLIGLEDLTNAWDDDNCWAVMRAFVCKQSVQNC